MIICILDPLCICIFFTFLIEEKYFSFGLGFPLSELGTSVIYLSFVDRLTVPSLTQCAMKMRSEAIQL